MSRSKTVPRLFVGALFVGGFAYAQLTPAHADSSAHRSSAAASAAQAASAAHAASTTPAATTPAPSSDQIVRTLRRSIRARVASGPDRGIVAGVLLPDGRTKIVAAGRDSSGKPLDGRAVFEIGSITKTFTASLLADMVHRNEVRLDQPVQELLPAGTKVPATGDRQIELRDLATQSSGLPRLPTNLGSNIDNPYADYTPAKLYDYLATAKLSHDVGTTWDYSNLGFGLLGHALSLKGGAGYESLLRQRILDPLGLRDTAITPTADMARRFVAGHDGDGKVVPRWDFDALAGAGALRSDASDLLSYARAIVSGDAPGELKAALADTQAIHFDAGGVRSGLAWVHFNVDGRELVLHDGGTAGFTSVLVLDPASKTAVVVLSNTATPWTVSDIGLHALVPSSPLTKIPTAVRLPAAALDRVAGRYDFDGTVYALRRAGDHLIATTDGQPPVSLYPSSRTAFFARTDDLTVTVKSGAGGRVTGLDIVLQGQAQHGTRLR
jgi:CubicO group peptidase (beta-lactamase class C family)